MNIRTFQAESLAQAQQALDAILSTDFQPTVAMVFASLQLDLKQIRTMFHAAGIDLFGATSSGALLEDGSRENNVFEEAMVAMLFDIDLARYKLRLFDGRQLSSNELGKAVGRWVDAETFDNPAVLLMASGIRTDGEAVVKGITQITGSDVSIFGGLSGDDNHFLETFVFDHNRVLNSSAIALVLDADVISVEGVAAAGWRAVGGEKVVTKSEGNIVYTIDDIPVVDIYREYLGFTEQSDPQLAPQYPLQILRREGYAVMRAALIVNFEEGYVVYAGAVPKGSRVRFCVPPGTTITEETLSVFTTFRQQQPAADAIILFSCKGRHLALGPLAEEEIRPFHGLWNVPLIGLYTYGEIGRLEQAPLDFHNETCVLVTLKDNHGHVS